MDRASRVRWVVLLSALGATLGAIFCPDGKEALPAAHRLIALAKAPKGQVAFPAEVDADDVDEGDSDPFAPRGWQPLPPAPQPFEAPKQAVLAALPQPIAPTGPPPLPFRFVGSLTNGADQVVYLGRGQQALVAHVGDVLDNSYKVVSIDSEQMEFEYLPTGQKQDLVFPKRGN